MLKWTVTFIIGRAYFTVSYTHKKRICEQQRPWQDAYRLIWAITDCVWHIDLFFETSRILSITLKWADKSASRAMRKCDFGHMRTGMAQFSLRIRAVWSWPSVFANRTTDYYRMYEWRAKATMILCGCAGLSESAHFTHVGGRCFANRANI